MSAKPVHYRTLIDNEWIGGWDLPEGGAVVVIESVSRYEPRQKKRDERNTKLDIGLKGKRKHFLANKTCQKAIAKLYGNYVEGWIGKPIGIYFDPSVKFGSEVVGGIRVHPRIPKAGSKPTEDPLDRPADEQRVQQLDAAREQPNETPPGRQPGED